MKALFDTSVLVASLVSSHVHHHAGFPWLASAKSGALDLVVSGHSVAELYSTLTRSRMVPQLSPSQVAQLIRDAVLAFANVAALSGSEYIRLLDSLPSRGLAGGIVYDAVHAAVAEAEAVDAIVTVNVSHFSRVWPGSLISPLTTHPPAP